MVETKKGFPHFQPLEFDAQTVSQLERDRDPFCLSYRHHPQLEHPPPPTSPSVYGVVRKQIVSADRDS